jgi:hypothetical protein
MSDKLTIECAVHFDKKARGRKELRGGQEERSACEPGRLPRVTKLLALAHRFDALLRDGVVEDYATLARLGRVTAARVTQIMNLLLLAPDIQEQVLFLPRVVRGRDPVTVRDLQPIALEPDWRKQRWLWRQSASGVSHGRYHRVRGEVIDQRETD